jgi:hypothetical protein
VSLPRCSACGDAVPSQELKLCKSCEHAFCLECMPSHAPCIFELRHEEVGLIGANELGVPFLNVENLIRIQK